MCQLGTDVLGRFFHDRGTAARDGRFFRGLGRVFLDGFLAAFFLAGFFLGEAGRFFAGFFAGFFRAEGTRFVRRCLFTRWTFFPERRTLAVGFLDAI